MEGDVSVKPCIQMVWGPKDPWCPGALFWTHSLGTGGRGKGILTCRLDTSGYGERVLSPRSLCSRLAMRLQVGLGC